MAVILSQRHKKIIDKTIRKERERIKQVEITRQRVAPVIGMDTALRLDDTHALYRTALDRLGYTTRGIDRTALRPLFDLAITTQTTRPSNMHLAMDRSCVATRFGVAAPRKL